MQLKNIIQNSAPGNNMQIIINRNGVRKALLLQLEKKPEYTMNPNLKFAAYRTYGRPYNSLVRRPYPYFSFGGGEAPEKEEMERE
jgi:hypothetical protein